MTVDILAEIQAQSTLKPAINWQTVTVGRLKSLLTIRRDHACGQPSTGVELQEARPKAVVPTEAFRKEVCHWVAV